MFLRDLKQPLAPGKNKQYITRALVVIASLDMTRDENQRQNQRNLSHDGSLLCPLRSTTTHSS